MAKAIEGLTPPLLWKYFGEISAIPRCSKNEAAIARHLVDTAGRLGLEAQQDGVGNVLVRKPASPGRGGVPMVCLQGHMDMVCEKNKDKVHDFATDPLDLVRHGNFLWPTGRRSGRTTASRWPRAWRSWRTGHSSTAPSSSSSRWTRRPA